MSLLPKLIEDRTPAQIAADEIRTAIGSLVAKMVSTQKTIFHKLWKPEAPLITQDILDALGPDAAQLFELGSVNVEMILRLYAGAEPPVITPDEYVPPKPYTIHEDGTVTLDPES